MDLNIGEIAKNISQYGYTTIPNIFDQERLKRNFSFLNQNFQKGQDGQFPVFAKQIFLKALKFDFKKIKHSIKLKKISNNYKFKNISDEVIKSPSELHMIDSYFSKKSSEDIITWHNDIGISEKNFNSHKGRELFYNASKSTILNKKTNVSSRGLKFFIYLTDVQSENGALAIIPFSNQIVKTVTALILENKISLTPFWNLSDLRKLVEKKNNKNLIYEKLGQEKVDTFIKQTEFINNKKNTTEFDIEMKKGSMIIFDELCVHRGSAPKNSDRLVIRYLYRKKLN